MTVGAAVINPRSRIAALAIQRPRPLTTSYFAIKLTTNEQDSQTMLALQAKFLAILICRFSRFCAIFLLSSPRRASTVRAAGFTCPERPFSWPRWHPALHAGEARGFRSKDLTASHWRRGIIVPADQQHSRCLPSWPPDRTCPASRPHPRLMKGQVATTSRFLEGHSSGSAQEPGETRPSPNPRPGPLDDAVWPLALSTPWRGFAGFTGL